MAIDKEAMRAAFNAGWTAAFTTIAEVAEKDGDRESARWFRHMAGKPPPVEIGDLSTPEGKAMAKQERDVVLMERIERADAGKRAEAMKDWNVLAICEELLRLRALAAPSPGTATATHSDRCIGRIHDSLGCSCGAARPSEETGERDPFGIEFVEDLKREYDSISASVAVNALERVLLVLRRRAASAPASSPGSGEEGLRAIVFHLMKPWGMPKRPLPDHACSACVGDGDLVIDGFRCIYHRALDVVHEAALSGRADATKGGK